MLILLFHSHEGHGINFKKSGNLGIQVAGGNAVGIFTAAVKPKSAAAKAGLKQGDLILEVIAYTFLFLPCLSTESVLREVNWLGHDN